MLKQHQFSKFLPCRLCFLACFKTILDKEQTNSPIIKSLWFIINYQNIKKPRGMVLF